SSGTSSIASSGGYNMLIAKYDGTLTPASTSFYKWAFTMGGSGSDRPNSIAVDSSGNAYVAGYTAYGGIPWDADPSSGTNNVASSGNTKIFIGKYDGTLTPASTSFYKWAFTMGGSNSDTVCNAIAISNSDKLYIAGYSSGGFDADPSTNTHYTLNRNNDYDILAIVYDASVVPSSTSFYQAPVW